MPTYKQWNVNTGKLEVVTQRPTGGAYTVNYGPDEQPINLPLPIGTPYKQQSPAQTQNQVIANKVNSPIVTAQRQRSPSPMRQRDDAWLQTLQDSLGASYNVSWVNGTKRNQVEIINTNFVAEPLIFNVNLQHQVSKIGTVPVINENETPGGVNSPAGVPVRAQILTQVHPAVKADRATGTTAKEESIDVVGVTPTIRLAHIVQNAFGNAAKEDVSINKAFATAVSGLRQEEYEENATRANKGSSAAAIRKHYGEITVKVDNTLFAEKKQRYAIIDAIGSRRAAGVLEPNEQTPAWQAVGSNEQRQFFQAAFEEGVLYNRRGNLQITGNVLTRTDASGLPVARLMDSMKTIYDKTYGINSLSTHMRPLEFVENERGMIVPRPMPALPNTETARLAGQQPFVAKSNIVQPANDQFPVQIVTAAMPGGISGFMPGGATAPYDPTKPVTAWGHGTKLGADLPDVSLREMLQGKLKLDLRAESDIGSQLIAGSRNLSLGTLKYGEQEMSIDTSKGEEELYEVGNRYVRIPSYYNKQTMEFTQGEGESDVKIGTGMKRKIAKQIGVPVRTSNLPGVKYISEMESVGLQRERGLGAKNTMSPVPVTNTYVDLSSGATQYINEITSEGAKTPDVFQHMIGALTNQQQSNLFNLWASNLEGKEAKAAQAAARSVEAQLTNPRRGGETTPLDLNVAANAYRSVNRDFVGRGRELAALIYQQQFIKYKSDAEMQAINELHTGSKYTLDPLNLGRYSMETLRGRREDYIRAQVDKGMTPEEAGSAFDIRYRPTKPKEEYSEVVYHPQPGEEYWRGKVERTSINAAETFSNEMGVAFYSSVNAAYPELAKEASITPEQLKPAAGASAAGSFLNYLINQRSVEEGGESPENTRLISEAEAAKIRAIPKETRGKAFNQQLADILQLKDDSSLLQFSGKGQPLIPNPTAINERGVFEDIEGTSIGKVGILHEKLVREAAEASMYEGLGQKGLAEHPESKVQKASRRLFGYLDKMSPEMINRARRGQSDFVLRAEASVNPLLNPGEFTLSKPYLTEIARRTAQQTGRSVRTEYNELRKRKDLGALISRDPQITEGDASLVPSTYVPMEEMLKRFGTGKQAKRSAQIYKQQQEQQLTMGISADVAGQLLGDVDGDKYIALLNLKYGNTQNGSVRVKTYSYPKEIISNLENARARELKKAGGDVALANTFNASVQGFADTQDPLTKSYGKIGTEDKDYIQLGYTSADMTNKGSTVGPTYGVATALQAAHTVKYGTSVTDTDVELAYTQTIDTRTEGKTRLAAAVSSANIRRTKEGVGYLGYSTEDPIDKDDPLGARQTNRLYAKGDPETSFQVGGYGGYTYFRRAAREAASPTASGKYLSLPVTLANMFGRDKEDTAALKEKLEAVPASERGNVLEEHIQNFYRTPGMTTAQKDAAMFETTFGLQQVGTAMIKEGGDETVANELAMHLAEGDITKAGNLKKRWSAVGVLSQLRKKGEYLQDKGRLLSRDLLQNALGFVQKSDPVHRLINRMMGVREEKYKEVSDFNIDIEKVAEIPLGDAVQEAATQTRQTPAAATAEEKTALVEAQNKTTRTPSKEDILASALMDEEVMGEKTPEMTGAEKQEYYSLHAIGARYRTKEQEQRYQNLNNQAITETVAKAEKIASGLPLEFKPSGGKTPPGGTPGGRPPGDGTPGGTGGYRKFKPSGDPDEAVQRAYLQTEQFGGQVSNLMEELYDEFGVSSYSELGPAIAAGLEDPVRRAETMARMSPDKIALLRRAQNVAHNRKIGRERLPDSVFANDPRYVAALEYQNPQDLIFREAAGIGAAFPGTDANLSAGSLMQADNALARPNFQKLLQALNVTGLGDPTKFGGSDFLEKARDILSNPEMKAEALRASRIATSVKDKGLLSPEVSLAADFVKSVKNEDPSLVSSRSTGSEAPLKIPTEQLEKLTNLYKEQAAIQEKLNAEIDTGNKAKIQELKIEKDSTDLKIKRQYGEARLAGLVPLQEEMRGQFLAGQLGEKGISRLDSLDKQIAGIQDERTQLDRAEQERGAGGFARRMLGGFGLMYLRSIGNLATTGLGYGQQERLGFEQATAASGAAVFGRGALASNQQIQLQNQLALSGSSYSATTAMQLIGAKQPWAREIGGATVSGISAWGLANYMGEQLGYKPDQLAKPTLGLGFAIGAANLAMQGWERAQSPDSLASRFAKKGWDPADDIAAFMLRTRHNGQFEQLQQDTNFYADVNRKVRAGGTTFEEMQNLYGGAGYTSSQIYTGTVQGYMLAPGGDKYTQEAHQRAAAIFARSPGMAPSLAAEQRLAGDFQLGIGSDQLAKMLMTGMGQSAYKQYAQDESKISAVDLLTNALAQSGIGEAEKEQMAGGMKFLSTLPNIGRSADVQNVLTATQAEIENTTLRRTELESAIQQQKDLYAATDPRQPLKGRTPQEAAAAHEASKKELERLQKEYATTPEFKGEDMRLFSKRTAALDTTREGELYAARWQAQQAATRGGVQYTAPSIDTYFEPGTDTLKPLSIEQINFGQAQVAAIEATSNYNVNVAQSAMNRMYSFGQQGLGNKVQQMIAKAPQEQKWAYDQLFNNLSPMMLATIGKGGVDLNAAQLPTYNGTTFGAAALSQQDQALNGRITGLGWGQTGFGQHGGFNASTMVNRIFGQDWQNNATLSQGAIQAGLTGQALPGGAEITLQSGEKISQVGGIQGMRFYQNQLQYNQQMAQIGIQKQSTQLQYAFTTGVGLSGYNNTINPVTGQAFGNLGSTGGFWGLEDRSRKLGIAQQEWQFGFQQQQMQLGNQQFMENFGLNQRQSLMQRDWTKQDWRFQDETRGMQWGWKQEDFQENVRFMTGRERRLAERQMGRETIMHDKEGEQIDKSRERQKELWKLEDERFDTQLKQHKENLAMSEESLKKAREFFQERKKIEEEQTKLQRAYFIQQQELNKKSADIAAYYAQENLKLNNTFEVLNLATQLAGGELKTMTEEALVPLFELFAERKDLLELIVKALTSSGGSGGGGGGGGGGTGSGGGSGGGKGPYKAAGGSVLNDMVNVTGEQGWEFNINGMIIPHADSLALAARGLAPGMSAKDGSYKLNDYFQELAKKQIEKTAASSAQQNLLSTNTISYNNAKSTPRVQRMQPIIVMIGNEELKRYVVNTVGEQF